ncbi:MAG TPA: hypothetical protein VM557_01310 [Thermoanaerobaculia bacterium]|nr:hypothetical protein [Thermoanaerobaculia bacterium]
MKLRLVYSLALLIASSTLLAAGEVGREFKESIPASDVRGIDVEIPIAELRVRNGAPGLITLEGTIRQKYSGNDQQWAETIVRSTKITSEQVGDRILIRRAKGVESKKWKAKTSPARISVTIYVPEKTAIRIEQSIGEIDLDGSFGDIDVDMKVGEITIRTPKKNIRRLAARTTIGEVETNLGDRLLTREGILAGETLYDNEAGIYDLSARSRIGEITIDLTP